MENKIRTQEEIKQEMMELNNQFGEFLHTKGIRAKFSLAINNIKDSAQKQHEKDVMEFEAIKAKSKEENKDFVEFLNTKGIKAKYRLVVENIKKGAKEAPERTATQISKIKADTEASVARANAMGKSDITYTEISADILEEEFNSFLKSKGLDGKYTVTVTEE